MAKPNSIDGAPKAEYAFSRFFNQKIYMIRERET